MSLPSKFEKDKIIGFHGEKNDNGFMSNFYPCQIKCGTYDLLNQPKLVKILGKDLVEKLIKGSKKVITFNCSEQYFMFMKAITFIKKAYDDNLLIINKIMNESDPVSIKRLGRKVKGFDNKTWNDVRFDYMYDAVFQKFSQNLEIHTKLLATGNKYLVETSATDKIWGIGISRYNPNFLYPAYWKGNNLLGKILMDVRTKLSK